MLRGGIQFDFVNKDVVVKSEPMTMNTKAKRERRMSKGIMKNLSTLFICLSYVIIMLTIK
jgi:hypothetical protein